MAVDKQTTSEFRYYLKEYRSGFVLAIVLSLFAAFATILLAEGALSGWEPSTKNIRRLFFLAAIAAFLLLGSLAFSLLWAISLYSRYRWLLGVISQRLEMAHRLFGDPNRAPNSPRTQKNHWPWGDHHTELLGHLEAAATQFWVRYDPSDPSTAPTNEMVSSWLRSERNISREKAQAIASILRADGLRTGPR